MCLCCQLYTHLHAALDKILDSVGTELATSQDNLTENSATRQWSTSGRSSATAPNLHPKEHSSNSSWSRSNVVPSSCSEEGNIGTSSQRSTPRWAAHSDNSRLLSAYDLDPVAIYSTLRIHIRPILEFVTQRLVTMNLWLRCKDFEQVRNTLCVHIAEVRFLLFCCGVFVHS